MFGAERARLSCVREGVLPSAQGPCFANVAGRRVGNVLIGPHSRISRKQHSYRISCTGRALANASRPSQLRFGRNSPGRPHVRPSVSELRRALQPKSNRLLSTWLKRVDHSAMTNRKFFRDRCRALYDLAACPWPLVPEALVRAGEARSRAFEGARARAEAQRVRNCKYASRSNDERVATSGSASWSVCCRVSSALSIHGSAASRAPERSRSIAKTFWPFRYRRSSRWCRNCEACRPR